ncbi:transcriptional regulator [Candidatus Finniella inopinata]|uniref:Helix-turn-helix domain-containing protein n=1 Tax=Candidatus Finniella inopinata TaxID=1696036 RepID=A0A4Q7DGX3_9PROT|nr:YdaS family helix-turn-helix protein [Candidatus Finniella inopinata]RZI45478.1 hypothetical protein EQU50_06960 [Candidatus Finniella inopinata]
MASNINRCNHEFIQKAIDLVGGATALAKKLNVSYHTVLTWKNGRSSVSTTNCQKIEKATDGKVKAKDILPDYPWDELK